MEGQAGREGAEAKAQEAPVVDGWTNVASLMASKANNDQSQVLSVDTAVMLGRMMADSRAKEIAWWCESIPLHSPWMLSESARTMSIFCATQAHRTVAQ